MSPIISIIMGVYKEPLDWLRQSIDSILNQSFTDYEFIIICDNPRYEEGMELLKKYANSDRRIILLFNNENIGLTKSLNKGLEIARGKYIARMDADDISKPERLTRQYEYMESHPEIVVLGTRIKAFGKVTIWFKPNEYVNYTDEELKAQMLFGNCIAHPTAMIRKSKLEDNNIWYDEDYKHSQDYRLWEQLMPYGNFAKLKQVLLLYRVSNQQITKKSSSSQKNLSRSISYRCQKKWLDSEGLHYSIDEIKTNPFRIIREVKKNYRIVKSKSFRAFVQFSYLNNPNSKSYILSFLKGDFLYMTFWNCIRYLIKH